MSNLFVDLESRATLIKNKLDRLSITLKNSTSFMTKEAYMSECARVLQNFYSQLDKPFFKYQEAVRDNTLLPITNSVQKNKIDYDYNVVMDQVLDNLTIIFMEMENLESISIANFNFAMTEANRLTGRLKSVSSKLGDFILYGKNTLSDVFLVKDSFNNLIKIDIGSQFLNEDECSVNQAEGIITLPVILNESKSITVEKAPVLNDDSNGVSGNNVEIGKLYNGDILAINDGNPDTWYEYEKIVDKSSENDPPLILDMVLDLGSGKICNQIIINPNNFGTKTVLNIDQISTSLNGTDFISVKDDIPISGFEALDEENTFTLAPSTSKYAGQGVYTFTPRKAKYIHVRLRQSEPYVIQTLTGEKLRYAIGLRDIEIKALKFKNKGELVSLPLKCSDEIKKVMLEVTQNPITDSDLTNISYMISHDNGISWNQIQPKHLTGVSGIVSVPEILNYNNSDFETIKTDTPVTSLRLKIQLEREDANFIEGSSSLFQKTATKSEIQGVPVSAPFTITLDKPPIEDSVIIVDPMFGSKGIKESSYYVKYNQSQSEDTFIGLPFKNINVPMKKGIDSIVEQQSADEWLFVYVGGERWHQRTKNWEDYESSDTILNVFDFNPVTGELSFSPDSSYACEQPPENAPISMHFGSERIFPSSTVNAHKAELDFPTSNSKADMIIERHEGTGSDTEQILAGSTRQILKHQNLVKLTTDGVLSFSAIQGDNSNQWTEKTFINGKEEFTQDAKQFSFDMKNGILHGSQPFTKGLTVGYDYLKTTTLTEDQWDWATDDLLRKTIVIKENGWKDLEDTETFEGEDFDSGTRINLKNMGIVRNSIHIAVGGWFPEGGQNFNNYFFKEVTFIDGKTEFLNSSDNGHYSVNYKEGCIHLNIELNFNGNLEISYRYSNYTASYRIAREVDSKHYEVDTASQQIAIKDGEFFRYLETPKTTQSGRAPFYLINYDYVSETRDDIQNLKDHFTPVVKDYVLKILKKGVLF